jgi:hypothetical protein
LFDGGNVPGRPTYVKSDFLGELDETAVHRLVDHGLRPASPESQVVLRCLGGGRLDAVDPAATAFPHRQVAHVVLISSSWTDPTDAQVHVDWVRDTWTALRPWTVGTYVNHLGDEGRDRLREAYPADTWERLIDLKSRMDPGNVFAMNQNIPPGDDHALDGDHHPRVERR